MTPRILPTRSLHGPALLLAAVLAVCLFVPHASRGSFPITVGNARLGWVSLPVSYVLQSAGSADVADDSDFLALRRAFQSWEDIDETSVRFTEDLTADASRTDYAASDIHLIWFDEDDSSGFFPGNSGTVAVTPITFDTGSGQILDADIIFNGDDHAFSTDGTSGTFDIQSIAAHEIGHFIGLDHSGSCAATMFPFAEDGSTHARSLTADDVQGARLLYPELPPTGSISGRVVRSDLSAVAGAHVAAVNDDGVVAGATVSASDGTFAVNHLPDDRYQVYAEPLDGPVEGSNLSSTVGGSAATDFETTYHGGNGAPAYVFVTGGSSQALGDLVVGSDVAANLNFAFQFPVLGRRGTSVSFTILGEGIGAGDTVTVSGGGVTIDTQTFVSLGGLSGFALGVSVDAGAILGPRNIVLDTADPERTVLTGFLEIVDPAPTLTSVNPVDGTTAGGDTVLLNGTGFVDGAAVRFGDQEAASVTVDSDTLITVTTPATSSPGTVSVVVQNPDGQIDVLGNAFTTVERPVIDSVFPSAGSTGGGTAVTITGSAFVSGLTVTFGGSTAPVTQVTPTAIDCVTPAGPAGTVNVTVTHPNSESDTVANAFTYVADPDPVVTAVTPASGSTAGGTEVTITGTHFEPAATVIFGQDLAGQGGVAATDVTFASATELTAVSPAFAAGLVAVTVAHPSGASSRLAGAYTYVAPAGGGGGGGGCFSITPVGKAPGPGDGIGALLPYVVLLIILAAARHRPPARPRPGTAPRARPGV